MTKAVTPTLRLADSEGPFGTAGFLMRPAQGFNIVSGLSPLDPRATDSVDGQSGARWLVPAGDGWERYPVTVRLALTDSFEKLALAPTEDAILGFANRWGWLGEPVPLRREGQGEVVPGSTESGLVEGERLAYWTHELLAFKERIDVLHAADVVANSDAHLSRRVEAARSVLSSRIEWIDGGVRYWGKRETPFPERWILYPPGDRPEDLVGRFESGDVVGPARFQMFREINEILWEHVHPGVPAFTKTPVVRLFPQALIGAIYVRLLSDGLGVDARERQCRNCGRYFTHGNAKRRYCTDKCRMEYGYQHRRASRRRQRDVRARVASAGRTSHGAD